MNNASRSSPKNKQNSFYQKHRTKIFIGVGLYLSVKLMFFTTHILSPKDDSTLTVKSTQTPYTTEAIPSTPSFKEATNQNFVPKKETQGFVPKRVLVGLNRPANPAFVGEYLQKHFPQMPFTVSLLVPLPEAAVFWVQCQSAGSNTQGGEQPLIEALSDPQKHPIIEYVQLDRVVKPQ